MSGIEAAKKYWTEHKLSLDFIPGIEMNTEVDETEVHILGYYIDHQNTRLLNKLEEIKEARLERARKMVYRLKSMGLAVTFEQVEKLARGDLIGRPHIAQALTEKGYVFSIKEAFEKYIGKGRPAYVPRYKFLPQDAIQLIKRAGGIPVLAHPGLLPKRELIQEAINLGVAGLEVYYPEHTHEQVDEYLRICREYHLLITGGSDFHGIGSEESRSRLGCTGIDQETYRQLYAYHQRQHIPS